MAKSYKELIQDLNVSLGSFAKSDMPSVMQAFQGLHKAAGTDGALARFTEKPMRLDDRREQVCACLPTNHEHGLGNQVEAGVVCTRAPK